MAIAAAFGLSSTSVAADPPEKEEKDYLSNQETQLTVRDVERGVTGTAYRYAYPDWNTTNDTPSTYNYVFEDQVAKWMNQKMRGGGILSSTS